MFFINLFNYYLFLHLFEARNVELLLNSVMHVFMFDAAPWVSLPNWLLKTSISERATSASIQQFLLAINRCLENRYSNQDIGRKSC